MKRPNSLSDANQICQDCITEWDKQIEVHAVAKEFKGKKYFTWANKDESGHVTKVNEEFFHVWSEAERAIAKEGQTAGLRAWRDAKKSDEIVAEIKPEGNLPEETIVKTTLEVKAVPEETKEAVNTDGPRVKEIDVADIAEPRLKAEALVECKVIHVIEQVVFKFLQSKKPMVEPNPNHIGMYVKLIRDSLEKK